MSEKQRLILTKYVPIFKSCYNPETGNWEMSVSGTIPAFDELNAPKGPPLAAGDGASR